MVMEKFYFFKNSLMRGGGHDEKLIFDLANRKKIDDPYELDNFKQKIFFERFLTKVKNFFTVCLN